MGHQCVHCGKKYPDAAPELLTGCECGSHFFMFFKQEDLNELKKETESLTSKEKDEIEEDVRDIVGDIDKSKPIILDFESIRIRKPGKFEIDLVSLFKRKPLVYKIDEGKYVIDLASTFQLSRGSKKSKKKKKK